MKSREVNTMRARILKQESNYNVQIVVEADGKEYYTGNGKFCDSLEEAERYTNRINHNMDFHSLSRKAKHIAFENYMNEFDPYDLSDNSLCKVTKKQIIQAIEANRIMFTDKGEII